MHLLAAICTLFQKLSPPPLQKKEKIQYMYFLLNFKKATILHNYLIYLNLRISSMYFKQIIIYYQDIQYIHCIYSNNKYSSYQILKSILFTRACAGIHLVLPYLQEIEQTYWVTKQFDDLQSLRSRIKERGIMVRKSFRVTYHNLNLK